MKKIEGPKKAISDKTPARMAAMFIAELREAAGGRPLETQQQLLLLVLYEKGTVAQSSLGQYTGVGTTSNNRNLKRLGPGTPTEEGLGWIETYRDPADQRYTYAQLTSMGLAQMELVNQKVASAFKRALKDIDES